MNDINHLFVPETATPTVEIDHASRSVYIRFKRARVHKTLSDNRPNVILTVDIDSKGEVIGIELVGIRELTINKIRRVLPARLKEIDFDRARWVPAGFRESSSVAA